MDKFDIEYLDPHRIKAEKLYEKNEEFFSYTIDLGRDQDKIEEYFDTHCYDASDYATPFWKDNLMKEIWGLDSYQSAHLTIEGDNIFIEEDTEPDVITIYFRADWSIKYNSFRGELRKVGLLAGLLMSKLGEGDGIEGKLSIYRGRVEAWLTIRCTYGS